MFPYYYKGGELHALKYGSFFERESDLFAIMQAEEDFIRKPNRRLRIWVDFYETNLTENVLTRFLENISHLEAHIIKLAIVGFSSNDKRNLKHLSKKTGIAITVPLRYFSDPEDAKTWLVSDGG